MERRAHHPLAELFPMLDAASHAQLRADIEANGLNEPIVTFEDMILDGRNREQALIELGFEPEAIAGAEIDFAETPWAHARAAAGEDLDALGFVLSKNLYRRHLNESQRAMVAAKIANMRQGGRTDLSPIGERLPETSQSEAAERLNVGKRSVERAAKVQDHAVPEVRAAVERGEVSVSAAAEIAELPKEEQAKIVISLPLDEKGQLTKEGRKAFGKIVRDVRASDTQKKKERRAAREQQLASKILALPERKFGVMLEDFEWDHEVWSRDSGMDRHASNHYPTAKAAHAPEEIVAATAERFSVAAEDCVLGMWTTNQHLAIAIRVMELRGFAYKTNFAWSKPSIGLGYWNRNKHELLLIGTRGKVVPPAQGTQFDSALPGDKGAHSEKPDWQYEIFERHFPNIPKLELNARRARPGWTAWGLDAPSSEGTAPRTTQDAPAPLDGAVPTCAAAEVPAHDPNTGEIYENEAASKEGQPSAQGPADPSASSAPAAAVSASASAGATCLGTSPPPDACSTGGDVAAMKAFENASPIEAREARSGGDAQKPDDLDIPPFLRRQG
jgi:N6-adenosine-specific RNA methylase IME4